MNWIVASLLMYFSSVALYLFIRKGQLNKIPVETYSLWMFGLPLATYFLLILFTKTSFTVTTMQFFKLAITGVFFSWLGNVFSQKSILYAPNPGYALIISKSYVVFTSLVAVFLFHSILTFQDVIAIILIIIFSALILFSNNKSQKKNLTNSKWIAYSFGAFFCWAFLALMSKHLLNQGVSVYVILFYVFLIVSICLGIETFYKKLTIKPNRTDFNILIGIGIGSMLFNLFMQIGLKASPNPGYINAANAASIAPVGLASAIIFKDTLSPKKVIGMIGVTLGLLLLFL